MPKGNIVETAKSIADDLEDKYTKFELMQLASTLFQRTVEFKTKQKWTSAEDDMIRTFFYLSTKEEMCEALSCDMESLYLRAKYLGVVSQSFQSLTSFDLGLATELFDNGWSQEYVLKSFGVKSVTVPVKALTLNDYNKISSDTEKVDGSQMELF